MTTQDEKPLGERNYEQFADRYIEQLHNKPHNAYYERPGTLSLLPDVTGLRVLDAGSGPGLYTEWLLDRGAQVVAIDVTPAMVEATKARAAGRAEAVLRHDLAQPLDFAADASFDLVICPLVLDYLEDWGPIFAEFARVLKPGGLMVASFGSPVLEYHLSNSANYLAIEPFTMEWTSWGEPYPVITGYRRPISAVFNPLIAAGLILDHVLEPLPTEDYKATNPEWYARMCREPGFLIIRARKP